MMFCYWQSQHIDFVVQGRHAILAIKGATMADSGPWKLRLENKFGSDEAVVKVSPNIIETDKVLTNESAEF